MDIPDYPLVFELNRGESIHITRIKNGIPLNKKISLISYKILSENNLWFKDSVESSNYYSARIVITVDEMPIVLKCRPYELPIVFNGLRIYVEALSEWNESADYSKINKMRKEVRFSACLTDETWGDTSIVYPIDGYRFCANSYNNTWSSLAPYNAKYYHRGEDMGAIPSLLNVRACAAGSIEKSPLPSGDGRSNSFLIKMKNGIELRYGHMDIDDFVPGMLKGNNIHSGELIGLTGMTWNGDTNQKLDPHLHIEMMYDSTDISFYPFLVEAYMRKYKDAVVAIAGGYRFAIPGDTILLDASRSFTAKGKRVQYYLWKLHDGKQLYGSNVSIIAAAPGLYSEELNVVLTDGSVDKDFLQLRVFDIEIPKKISQGWLYHYPIRNIHVGDTVLFKQTLIDLSDKVTIDFGDYSKRISMNSTIKHAYLKPGNYTVEVNSFGQMNEPISIKTEVVVEN